MRRLPVFVSTLASEAGRLVLQSAAATPPLSIPPEVLMPDDTRNELVEMYRARGLPEAQALVFRLEEAGIAARIDNEMLQGIVGEVPAGWVTAPLVIVRRRDLDIAQRVLAEFLPGSETAAEESVVGLRCLDCGAAMGSAHTCPNCGWTYASDREPPVVPESPNAADVAGPPMMPAPPAAEQPASLTVTGRAAWFEVAAVLAVGVVPHFLRAITAPGEPSSSPDQSVSSPSFVHYAVHLAGLSVCISFVTLYIIARSGEPWARFGLTRPRLWDLPLGLGMLVLGNILWLCCWGLGMFGRVETRPFGIGQQLPQFGMVVIMNVASAFAEELVTRAYLITRLEVLLCSRGAAVLVAAFFFASYHVYQGLRATIPVFVIGVVYGVAYLGIRRVWPLVIGHALFDVEIDLLYW